MTSNVSAVVEIVHRKVLKSLHINIQFYWVRAVDLFEEVFALGLRHCVIGATVDGIILLGTSRTSDM
jgi:hypothetical protein